MSFDAYEKGILMTRILAFFIIIYSVLFNPNVFAAEPRDILKNLSGCFRVTYRFVEDGVHDSRYESWQNQDFYEWITLKENGSVLQFQHYGVAGDSAMKHWRE